MTPPRTLEEFRVDVIRQLTQYGYRFQAPKHDWPPCQAFVQHPDGVERSDVSGIIVTIGGGRFNTDEEKDLARDIIREAIAKTGAFRYAAAMNSHMVFGEEACRESLENRAAGGRLQDLPGAIEMMTVTVGDAEEEQLWQARILRDKRRIRRLGEFYRVDAVEDGVAWTGRFLGLGDLLSHPRERRTA